MPVTSEIDVSETERPPEAATDALPINELFESLQGEGTLTGVPSVFIRTSGCNLRCWFCDSYHTSWEPTHAWLSIDEIIDQVTDFDATHVVLTGGEPLIHEQSIELMQQLSARGYHITVETNGTIVPPAETPIDLASVSPKLASSTPTADRPPAGGDAALGSWADKHEADRIDSNALATLFDRYNTQLKFVVTGESDVPEITELVSTLQRQTETPIESTDVLLMPEGQTRAALSETRRTVAELALEHGYRYTPRIHVDLWNDAPET